jgi:DinB superfamily
MQFGDGTHALDKIEWPGRAADGIAFLERHRTAWRNGVAALAPSDLSRKVGPSEGPYSESPIAELILHLNRELFHHGGEIALLRDLYRASHQGQRWTGTERGAPRR